MYGMAVHKAVIESKEEKTGVTVHVVTDKYDEGPIVFQCETDVEKNETVDLEVNGSNTSYTILNIEY